MPLYYRVDDDEVQRLLRHLKNGSTDMTPALQRIGRYMVKSSIALNFRDGGRPDKWQPTKRGGQPLRDTGRLQGSIAALVIRSTELRIGTSYRGARLHQQGGIVKPVRARALAIPLPGVRMSPRRYAHTFLLKTNASGDRIGAIAQKKGKKGVRILFVLRSRVQMPARPFLVWQPEDIMHVQRVLLDHLGVAP